MNMVDLSEFYAHIRQYAPGVPNPTANFAIRQAAIDFCQRTKMWRYEDDFDVIATDCDQITTPADSVLLDLEAVMFDGCKLVPQSAAWLDENMRGWRTLETTGGPARYFNQTEQDTIRLVPGADGHVHIYAWLKPSQDAEQVPEFLAAQYREQIAHGALARILTMPGTPFSNPGMAGMFIQMFSDALDRFQNKGSTGQQRARIRTKASFL